MFSTVWPLRERTAEHRFMLSRGGKKELNKSAKLCISVCYELLLCCSPLLTVFLFLFFQLMNALKMGVISNSRLAMAAQFSAESEVKSKPIPVERSGGGVWWSLSQPSASDSRHIGRASLSVGRDRPELCFQCYFTTLCTVPDRYLQILILCVIGLASAVYVDVCSIEYTQS